MNIREPINKKCPCGSGKKYKNCCEAKTEGFRQLHKKITNGEIPFGARAISSNGESGSMEIKKVAITQNGRTKVLLDDQLRISTNTISGDKTELSMASISIPTKGAPDGSISTVGNASITNQRIPPKISLANGVKKIKARSAKGTFVVVRTALQRDTNIEYFDFMFGVSGQSEETDESGRKQRSHVSIHPDGNGKFIRLAGYDCEIGSSIGYIGESRTIYPKQLRIKSSELKEIIEVSFITTESGEVVLENVVFSDSGSKT